jgi:hypothetical protein
LKPNIWRLLKLGLAVGLSTVISNVVFLPSVVAIGHLQGSGFGTFLNALPFIIVLFAMPLFAASVAATIAAHVVLCATHQSHIAAYALFGAVLGLAGARMVFSLSLSSWPMLLAGSLVGACSISVFWLLARPDMRRRRPRASYDEA